MTLRPEPHATGRRRRPSDHPARARRAAASLLGALAALATGCAVPHGPARLDHAHPPAPGTRIVAQPLMLRCATEAAALSASETGFVAAGCHRLTDSDRWHVTGRRRVQLDEGAVWLIELRDAKDARVWMPLPWHDWA